MQLSAFALPLAVASLASSSSVPTEYLFSNPPVEAQSGFNIPSIHESAVQARRILHLQGIATFSTVFPSPSTLETRPKDVAHTPIGLMEYYALCAPSPYNPTFIGITIATTSKNAAAGSNVTLSLRYHLPSDPPQPPADPWAYIPANLPRFSLIGYIERLSEEEAKWQNVTGCFFDKHPDSEIWAPGSDVHDAWWGRLVVREVYFFGGFGDRARIGWIPVEVWQNVTLEEVEEYRLVGEKGYRRSGINPGPAVLGDEARYPVEAEL
ncbi:MAG: hypothetical protein MMC23_004851 [Stictis urceolatum]|nr:hypothetical protein [Stictis urceolata]